MPAETVRVFVIALDDRLLDSASALPRSRFEVGFWGDAYLAFEEVARAGCDVAVVDLQLGGFNFGRDVRSIEGGDRIAIVMTCDRPQDKWLCMQGGADEVLVKPLSDTSLLLDAVESAMKNRAAALQP